MAIIKLPLFDQNIALVNEKGSPSIPFHQWWQRVVRAIEEAFVDIAAAVEAIEQALEAAGIALATAQAAQGTADNAEETASDAQDTANTALTQGEQAERIASLVTSGTISCTLTSDVDVANADAHISSHTRVYGNGEAVNVIGGTVHSLSFSTTYYIYYFDASRQGGEVTYIATQSPINATQVADRHLVGIVTTPPLAGSPTVGKAILAPGINLLPEL